MATRLHESPHRRRIGAQTWLILAIVLVAALIPAWFARHHLGFGAKPSTEQLPALTAHISGHVHIQAPLNAAGVVTAGPITELDKQLLVKVRQADLWEMQAGRLAQTHASSEQVKRAGLHLLDGHSKLDQMVREMAEALQVPIPSEPSAEQQSWVKRLQNSRGAEFDAFFANQLRNSHGKVFVVIAKVRAVTQNSVVRDLAIEANTTVADHLQAMEDTGLVDPSTFEDVAKDVTK